MTTNGTGVGSMSIKAEAVLVCRVCVTAAVLDHEELARRWPRHCGHAMHLLYNG